MKQLLPHATAFCLTLSIAAPALAAEALSAQEFEAYVTGKTLYYGASNKPYGVEKYLANRRVQWSFLDGNCKDGRWYEDRDQICFVYEDNPDPQCWSFYLDGDGLRAQYENNETQPELYEVGNADEPMLCLGPDVGV